MLAREDGCSGLAGALGALKESKQQARGKWWLVLVCIYSPNDILGIAFCFVNKTQSLLALCAC